MTKQKSTSNTPKAIPKSSNSSIKIADRDFALRRFREYVAAGIAGVVVLGTILMLVMAINTVSDDGQFSKMKDLLLIINPLLGVVLGYYFNKASTEARAENAEAAAKEAVTGAQEAGKARDAAQAEAKEAKAEAGEMWTALVDVRQAAERMMATTGAPLVARSFGPGEETSVAEQDVEVFQARRELEAALERAKRVKR